MRIAVCDDEEQYCMQMQSRIEAWYHSLDVVVDTYLSGKDLLKRFDRQGYDPVFLDIEMPGVDGISLAKKLRERDEEIVLVFLTSHVEYALKGYGMNVLRYLTKPVREETLKEVLCYVMEKMQSKRRLWLKTETGEEGVALSEILYLEAQNQNVSVVTAEQSYLIRYNLGDFERELREDGFIRIHRGYLVSLGKVIGVQKNEVVLTGDIRLPLSRTREKSFKEALYHYIKGEAF